MTSEQFVAGDWIDRLALALAKLAEAQEPWLHEYYKRTSRVLAPYAGRNSNPPAFPLDDVQILYARACHSKGSSEEKHYAALLAALDPVRYVLLSHPTLDWVVGRIIGRNEFWMQILDFGRSACPTDLIAGLIARASELSGDRFRAAASELNAFLAPAGDGESAGVLGDLEVGYDAVLFWGLTLEERIDLADGMVIIPFEQVRAYVDERLVKELAPLGAGFHDWSSVGAAVRPFRWRPEFRREGSTEVAARDPTGPFFRDARIFLELLAVAHRAPVLRLAELSNCIDRSAGRLLGRERHGPGFYQSWPAQGFDGVEVSPKLAPEALAEAREAFENRKGERYGRMAPVIGRLTEALAQNRRFAGDDRILDVAIALERMYDLPRWQISRKLRNRVSLYLGTDAESRKRVKESVEEFYNVRSDIVHGRPDNAPPQRNRAAFVKGFDIAQRSLFKLLREGAPDDWDKLVVAGS